MSSRGRSVAIILAVLILDRITKYYIQTNFSLHDVYVVIPNVFNIVHVENPGAAFSLLADAPEGVRRAILVGLSGAVMIAIAFLLFRKQHEGNRESAVTMTGLALVLGGAFGNFWDRVAVGTVTDFIQVFLGSYEYPSFNVADSAVFCGAVLLILDILRGRRNAPAAAK